MSSASDQELAFILKMRDEASAILNQFGANVGKSASAVKDMGTAAKGAAAASEVHNKSLLSGVAAFFGFKNAGKDAAVMVKELENDLKSIRPHVSSFFGGFANVTTLAGVAPELITVAGAIYEARNATQAFSETLEKANNAGLSSNLFQTLEYAATKEGMSTDKLNTALETFATMSNEAAYGQGRLHQELERINPSFARQLETATTMEERLKVVAQAMQSTSDASARAALSTAAFSRNNIEMTQILGEGVGGLARFQAEARSLGLVVSKDVLENAKRMNSEFNVSVEIIDNNLKQAFIGLAPAIQTVVGWVSSLIQAFNDWIVASRDHQFEGISDDSIKQSIAKLNDEIASNQKLIDEYSKKTGYDTYVKTLISDTVTATQALITLNAVMASRHPKDYTPKSPGDEAPGNVSGGAEDPLVVAKRLQSLAAEYKATVELSAAKNLSARDEAIQQAVIARTLELRKNNIEISAQETAAVKKLAAAQFDLAHQYETLSHGVQRFFEDYRQAASDTGKLTHDFLMSTSNSLEQGLTSTFSTTLDSILSQSMGIREKLRAIFHDMVTQILAEFIRLFVIKQILNSIFGAAGGGGIGGLFAGLLGGIGNTPVTQPGSSAANGWFYDQPVGQAKGGAWRDGIQMFAKGGIVKKATLFPMAKGMGLMGEAGPEAVMPLTRDSQGNLGVRGGSSTTNVDVSPNISISVGQQGNGGGTSEDQARKLGATIHAEVQKTVVDVITRESRPGGILRGSAR